jgi:hypothetical protein
MQANVSSLPMQTHLDRSAESHGGSSERNNEGITLDIKISSWEGRKLLLFF